MLWQACTLNATFSNTKFNKVIDTVAQKMLWHKRNQLLLLVPAKSLVLDVGSGNRPLPQASILCDLYLTDDTHRGGDRQLIRDNRPFIVCDVHHLPFRNKVFGFVNCSSVLEHVTRPNVGICELRRVAEAGYIETPTLVREVLSRQLFHKHIITCNNGQFYIQPNRFPRHALFHFLWGKLWLWKILWTLLDELFSLFTSRIYFDKNGFHKI